MSNDHSERMALFRYSVISEALDAHLSAAERGLIVRALAGRTWPTPNGDERSFSRGTIDRWIAAYRCDGLGALAPNPRTDRGRGRVEREWMAEAVRLRREVPARSAAQITEIIGRAHGVWLKERTVRAHLARTGVSRRALSAEPAKAFGRYEASARNERWIGDVLVGPFVPHPRKAGSRRAKLFVLVDDYSRLLVAGRWTSEENTRAGQEVLRAAIMRRGVPRQLYMDNGSPYRAGQLARTCAVLGIHVVHSKPYSPQGRGKQERLNRYIRERFLTEAEAAGIESFEVLNDHFSAWAEQVANTRIHAETKHKPIERFLSGGPIELPAPDLVREAFRWSVLRRVTKTATVSLLANRYSVDPALIGRNVELRFDPEDLGAIGVYADGVEVGTAVPFSIGRHVHPSVPQAQPPGPTEPTGIDYLGLVSAAEDEAQGSGRINYAGLVLPGFEGEQDTDGASTDDGTQGQAQ
jgi:putative transposase